MLPEELDKMLSENDEDDIRISINRVDFSPEQLTIDLIFVNEIWSSEDQEELETQRWKLTVPYPVNYNIAASGHYQFELLNKHPILLPHTDKRCSLYFKGPAEDVKAVKADLFAAQMEVFGALYNLATFMNNERNIDTILRAPSALLATAPRTLIDKYAECLEKHNLPYSIVDGWAPTYWDGEKNVNTVEKLKLLLMGDTYFIGERFLFEKCVS